MEPGWLQNLLLGFLSGLTEILPVSSQAHQRIALQIIGADHINPLVGLFIRLGILAAVLLSTSVLRRHIRKEQAIARQSRRRRRRDQDRKTMLDVRLLKTAAVPMLLVLLLSSVASQAVNSLLILAIVLILNGAVLYFPSKLRSANKDSRSLAPLDSWMIGIGAALSVFPGFSRIGGTVSMAVARGADRRYALNLALLLSIPALILLSGLDAVSVVMAGGAGISLPLLIQCIGAAATSFAGAYAGLAGVRFVTGEAGLHGFAYYSWGAALFSFILYLTV